MIVALAAMCAAGFVVAARRLRGRSAWGDAFLPLAWLHWAHGENVLSTFQVCFLIPLALATFMFLVVLRIERSASRSAKDRAWPA